MRVLNVGGGANRDLPAQFKGWEQHVLDIDPTVGADLVCDARELGKKKKLAGKYDAVFCSHAIEHFYRHDVPLVLRGFLHVLRAGGQVEILCPNLLGLIHSVVQSGLEPDDTWYRTGAGDPISFHDVLYGWGKAMGSGNLFYAHKCGFTPNSLGRELAHAGFVRIGIGADAANIRAVGHKEGAGPCQ